jgi:hypothetical protein
MSIARTVLAPLKLRQERDEDEPSRWCRQHAMQPEHRAPDGAWIVLGAPSSINMSLLPELSPPKHPASPRTATDPMKCPKPAALAGCLPVSDFRMSRLCNLQPAFR